MDLEVGVNFMECLFEFLARDLINFFNSGGGVFDRVDQIFALGLKELVAFGSFLILFERHHVDRPHGVQTGSHLAMSLILSREFLTGQWNNRGICQQYWRFDIQAR